MARGSRSLRRPLSLRAPHGPRLLHWGPPAQDSGPPQEQAAGKQRRGAAGGDGALAEAAHSLGPGDGQRLIAEPPRLVGGRVKACKQQVQHSLRHGWETFVTNLNSLTLSLPAKKTQTVAGPSRVAGGAP